MEADKTEEIVLSTTLKSGEVIHKSIGIRSFLREEVPIKNAPIESRLSRAPNFTQDQKKRFARLGLIPLSEIRYWLGWANALRQDSNENPFNINACLKPGLKFEDLTEEEKTVYTMYAKARHIRKSTFDFPTAKSILLFLNLTLKNYLNLAPEIPKVLSLAERIRFNRVSAVPIIDYLCFLNQFDTEKLDRAELIKKLDEFVGTYL